MSHYQANVTLAQAADRLRCASSFLLATHAKPDGDAWGSVVALSAALQALGKTVYPYFMPPIPESFRDLPGHELGRSFAVGDSAPPADCTIIVDTGAWSQLWPMKKVLEPNLAHTLILDHHLSGDVGAAQRYVDSQAAACCEIVAQVIELLDQGRDPAQTLFSRTVCDALFVGLASDTGWFRFSNARPLTHEWAARLLRRGVDHAELYRRLEQMERREKLDLLIRALDSVELIAGGRAAIMSLRAADFAQTGALLEETERFVDIPQMVGSVELVVMMTQTPDKNSGDTIPPAPGSPAPGGAAPTHAPAHTAHHAPTAAPASSPPAPLPVLRLSFRSKPGPRAVDVAQLASQFHGGGHARAAGAKVQRPWDQVYAEVCQAMEKALAKNG